MRVLWFTNIPMPAMDRRQGIEAKWGGHWMVALLKELAGTQGLKLGVACACPGRPSTQFSEDGVDYFVLHQRGWRANEHVDGTALRDCATLASEWKPDLVHIHGTERFYGLLGARQLVPCPCLISIQGLVDRYSQHQAFLGALTIRGVVRAYAWGFPRGGLISRYVNMRSMARQERDIVRGNRYFMGRTVWDRAWVMKLQPDATYYHGDEILRREFYLGSWSLSGSSKHSIMSTNIGEPRRGTETLLDATALLRRAIPGLELKLAGNLNLESGYGRLLLKRVSDLGMRSSVKFLGYLGAGALCREACYARVFVTPSFIENSPNSLCEAMLLGMPCVATYTGGIPSLLSHQQDGLLFPPGDFPVLAEQVKILLDNDDLAQRLGQAARIRAQERHRPEAVVEQVLDAYHDVLKNGP